MKKYTFAKNIVLMLAIGIVIGMANGCTTSQQRVAHNTIFSVEQVASTAVDGYFAAVIKGKVSTNAVPEVTQRFNQLQAACTLAAATAEAGTNAIASSQLSTEAIDLAAFIATLK